MKVVTTVLGRRGWVETFAFLECLLVNQRRFVEMKNLQEAKGELVQEMLCSAQGTPVLLGIIFVDVSEFWILYSET